MWPKNYLKETSPTICKANPWTGWCLYDRDLRHEIVKEKLWTIRINLQFKRYSNSFKTNNPIT